MTQNTNMNPRLTEHSEVYFHKQKLITWSAVITGALLAFGLTFLFHLLVLGIGFSVYTNNEQGLMDLAFNGFICTLIGGFILLFFSGWKTGKLIKICPKHFYEQHYVSNSALSGQTAETSAIKCHHCCSNSMTHGFLAWVVYLIISLIFFAFISNVTALGFLKSPYLNLPISYSQTNAVASHNGNSNDQSMNNAGLSNANRITSANLTSQNQVKPVAPAVVHKQGSEVIAVFLIFLFGATGSALGSYLGFLSKKKCFKDNSKL
jgi:hypothetical protein